jgi:hypothetical protein
MQRNNNNNNNNNNNVISTYQMPMFVSFGDFENLGIDAATTHHHQQRCRKWIQEVLEEVELGSGSS